MEKIRVELESMFLGTEDESEEEPLAETAKTN
jgi:hypothetical protein